MGSGLKQKLFSKGNIKHALDEHPFFGLNVQSILAFWVFLILRKTFTKPKFLE